MTNIATQRPSKPAQALRFRVPLSELIPPRDILKKMGLSPKDLESFPQKIEMIFEGKIEGENNFRFDKSNLEWEQFSYCSTEWYETYKDVASVYFGREKPSSTHYRVWMTDSVGTLTGWRYIPWNRVNECVDCDQFRFHH